MDILFRTKQNNVYRYKTLGKDCQNAGVGQEMEELVLDNVRLTSEEDVKKLIRVLNVVQAGFVEYKDCDSIGEEQLRELIRRTD